MTQPPKKAAARPRTTDPGPGPVPDPVPVAPPSPVDVVLTRFLAIREALRGPAANDPNRDQKLWVIPGFQ